MTAEVSEPSPWIGQQFTYTFRLFNAVQVTDAKFQAPDFNGLNAEELEDRKSYRTVVNGREFIVTEVTFILVPVKTGTLEIEPAVLQVALPQRNRRPRPFAGMDAFFGRSGDDHPRFRNGSYCDPGPRPAAPASGIVIFWFGRPF